MNAITIEEYNNLPLEEQWAIFMEGYMIGERTFTITPNKQWMISWARLVEDFYVIQKLSGGKRIFEAVEDVELIEPYLESFDINWSALGIMKDEDR